MDEDEDDNQIERKWMEMKCRFVKTTRGKRKTGEEKYYHY
jgi:hypothetical protein|tara:strand:+ start:240 stop:359 length:120 start_codon:yes stop_codon:yes gene_type:complete